MKKKYGRKSVKGVNIKNVKLFPNGKRSAETKVKDLATTGIQLRKTPESNQIVELATSLLEMDKAGYTEVNITCWLKTGQITFTSEAVEKEETQYSDFQKDGFDWDN